MKSIITRLLICIALACACIMTPSAQAAKAPMKQEALHKESDVVITGRVLKVEMKIEQAKRERAKGNTDKVYTLTVRVGHVIKGEGLKVGDEITVEAWEVNRRVGEARIGLQSYENIPKKGERRLFYLENKGQLNVPLHPNGMQPHEEQG